MMRVDKLDRPPAVENWSRMQHPEVTRTAKKVFSFLKGGLSWNYTPSRQCARYYIEDGISRETAIRIASTKGSALGRSYNIEVVNAWFDYVERNPIEGIRAFDQMVEYFPLGAGAYVPIKPLAVVRHQGSFMPIFFNPWSSIAFDDYQARLYFAVLERSVFRLTDFESSPGKIIFLPKVEISPKVWQREPIIWERGQFGEMSDSELNEQIRIFAEGKELAKKWLREQEQQQA